MVHIFLVHSTLFWCALFIAVASTLRIRFIVHYTMNSYSVWCVLLVSVWNPHWRLGGWHSKLISCYLLLHVLQCFELTLFCYCLDTCPFVMSNIHAVVFFSLSVSDFYNACMVYLVLYSFYSYRPVTFLLHYRYYLIILFDFNVFHILLQFAFLWYSVQIHFENS